MSDFTKDGNYYRIKSKYITHKYDVTPDDRIYIDKKLQYQTDFLKKNQIVISDDHRISLFDVSMSANVRPDKYLAEISNRVDAFKKYCQESAFTLPVFLTMTPDTRFKPCRVVKTKKEGYYILADNPNFTGGNKHFVIECREDIQRKFRKFLQDQLFKDIKKKYGERAPHFSSYEPFVDGALHKHTLFFIPPEFLTRFTARFHHYFNDVQRDVKTVFDEEVGGVSAYILKYILKSFRHAETGELSDEGYWYAKHGLSRFSSARVLMPLYIWRSVRSPDRSYFDLSKEYKNGNLQISIVCKHHSHALKDFKRSNYNLAQVDYHHYDNDNVYLGYETLYSRSVQNFDVISTDVSYDSLPDSIKHENVCSFYPMTVFVDGQSFSFDGFNLRSSPIPIPHRKSTDLYKYFQQLDPEICNLQHYHFVKNNLIERGLLSGDRVGLNDAIIKFD